MEYLYRLESKSKITGLASNGKWFEDLQTVQQLVDDANKKFPHIKHWVGKKSAKESQTPPYTGN